MHLLALGGGGFPDADADIPADSIRLVPGYEYDSERTSVASGDHGGFWNSLENFFFPAEDRATRAEGLRRGGLLVSVAGLNESDYQTAHDILNDEGSIDIDERADSWRAEGWNSTATASTSTYDRNASESTPLDRASRLPRGR